MNTLNQIKKQIIKKAALHDAQILHTTYRGVKYDTGSVESKETHGTFCYRGHLYQKWLTYLSREGFDPLFFYEYKLVGNNIRCNFSLIECIKNK